MPTPDNDNAYTEEHTTSPEPVDILLEKLAAKLGEIETRAASTPSAQRIPPDVPRFVTRR